MTSLIWLTVGNLMLQAALLERLSGIRHGFFTRTGGVSDGVYATLNGGTGSNDAPDKIAENRARMAQALGVQPAHFLTAHQIHSPDVVVAEEPWPQAARPRADAIVTKRPRLAMNPARSNRAWPARSAGAKKRALSASAARKRSTNSGPTS